MGSLLRAGFVLLVGLLVPCFAAAVPGNGQGPPFHEVEVVNPVEIVGPILVEPLDVFPRTPFGFSESLEWEGTSGVTAAFSVPAGFTLVIESVTLRADTSVYAELRRAVMRTRTGGADLLQELPLAPQVSSFKFSSSLGLLKRTMHRWDSLRAYADPGSPVEIQVFTLNSRGVGATVTVSGYLVPVGSPSLAP